jgi:type I restriction enzyme, S subunit
MTVRQVPPGWAPRRLDAIGAIYSGSTPSTTNPAFWDGDIVWVTPYDLSKLRTPYLTDSRSRITAKGLVSCSTHRLPARSVVISSRAPIGYVGIPTVAFCTNQGCKSIELKSNYNSEFTYYNILFRVDEIRRAGEGTTFAEISKSALANIELPFPKTFSEQEKIAEVISQVDQAIAKTEAAVDKQKRISTGLMQTLLSNGIDDHGQVRSEKTHSYQNSPLGRIPVEWEVKSLAYLTTKIVDGVHHTPTYVEAGVPFLVITDLTSGRGIDFSNTRFVSDKDHTAFRKRAAPAPGDVLVTKDGTLGTARIVPQDAPEFSIFVSLAMLRPKVSIAMPGIDLVVL